MYSETIAGVAVLRAFGASSKFLRDMLQHVDTVSMVISSPLRYFSFPQNCNPSYWTWGVGRWLSVCPCLHTHLDALHIYPGLD
jgi:hypothetical protein